MLIFLTNVFSFSLISCVVANFTPTKPSLAVPHNVTTPDVGFHRLDLRVGFITHVWEHPNASHLYCETVDVGEGQDRMIVSGLGHYMQAWQLVNTSVVVVCNLKPAKFRGVMSHGMILCASETYNNITRVEVVRPPENSIGGHRVFVQNRTGLPDRLLNPKEKVWPRIQVDLRSDDEGNIVWRNEKLQTINGPLKVYLLHNAAIY